MFNESQHESFIARGLLKPQYLRNAHLKEPEKKNLPLCARSQMIRYVDNSGQWIVEVHQYLCPDGRLGGSGKPDPKRIRSGNIVFAVPVVEK